MIAAAVKKPLITLVVGLACSFFWVLTADAAEGFATYYTTESCKREGTSGVWTASGERYDEKALTCALALRSFGGSYVVYGERTGRSVIVRHNDFGPGRGPRARGVIIDLTPAAFVEVCGDLKIGRCQVSVQEVKTLKS